MSFKIEKKLNNIERTSRMEYLLRWLIANIFQRRLKSFLILEALHLNIGLDKG